MNTGIPSPAFDTPQNPFASDRSWRLGKFRLLALVSNRRVRLFLDDVKPLLRVAPDRSTSGTKKITIPNPIITTRVCSCGFERVSAPWAKRHAVNMELGITLTGLYIAP